jgi:hypothetical protein
MDLLPEEARTLTPQGVKLFTEEYYNLEVGAAFSRGMRRVTVKFDPRDLSEIYVDLPEGFVTVGLRFPHRGPPPPLWLYVRTALFVLAEPPDPVRGDTTALGKDWLVTRYSHSKIAGWQSLFAHAVQDPLILLTTGLPRRVVLELNERTLLWPTDLRRRWTYAAAVGAVGGYVF